MSVHSALWLHFEPAWILNFNFDADPDPPCHFDANPDPDPASQNDTDPEHRYGSCTSTDMLIFWYLVVLLQEKQEFSLHVKLTVIFFRNAAEK